MRLIVDKWKLEKEEDFKKFIAEQIMALVTVATEDDEFKKVAIEIKVKRFDLKRYY